MQILNIQEISNVSGGSTSTEIIDMGALYGGTVGMVLGTFASAVIGSSVASSPLVSNTGGIQSILLISSGLALGAVYGCIAGAALGVVFSFPFAAFYGENLHCTKK